MSSIVSASTGLAGKETLLYGNNQQPTYARIFEETPFYCALRTQITETGETLKGVGYKQLGEKYSETTSGATFVTLTTFDGKDASLNCFAYALRTFGIHLEKLTKQTMSEIEKSVRGRIDQIVKPFFDNIDKPKDGDLVIYFIEPTCSWGTNRTGMAHAAIYRESKDSSTCIVESKWGPYSNPYAFRHDLFYVPGFYGKVVKFYRPKALEESKS